MKTKKLTLLPLLALAVGSLASCNLFGKKKDKPVVWSFSDEMEEICEELYGDDVEFDYKTSVKQVTDDLRNARRSGRGVPDIIALEAAVVADFTALASTDEECYLEPLDDVGDTSDMYEYTKKVATSTDGKMLALSWQATPGGFFYRKSIASKLGINSPEAMEAKISTWQGFLELAAECSAYDLDTSTAGIQKIYITSSITEPIKVFLGGTRDKAWVENGKLQLEDKLFGTNGVENSCFDIIRALQTNGYTHQTVEREPCWYGNMRGNDTLGYFCSSWGLHFDLMAKATTTFGDWQMCKAPSHYFKGGTWLAIPKGCEHPEEAKKIIKDITLDKEFLRKRCEKTGDFMNSRSLMQELSANASCDFLGGQNHLKILYEVANSITGELISPYDLHLDNLFTSCAADFAKDEASSAQEVDDARQDQIDIFVANAREYLGNAFF